MSQQEESILALQLELDNLKAEFALYKREMEDVLSVLANDPEDFVNSLQPCKQHHSVEELWYEYRRYCYEKRELFETRERFERLLNKVHLDTVGWIWLG